jgi:hypothetical protein
VTKPKAAIPVNKHRRAGTGTTQWKSAVTPGLNAKRSSHRIDDISFSQDFIVCLCSWKGPIDEFQPHRKDVEPQYPKRHDR